MYEERPWDEKILNHPEVKALIESGEWDKMSHMGQVWFALDLIPWAPGARESLEQTIAESRLAYKRACEVIPDDYGLYPKKHI
ncbi:MAG: hypothetical protein LBT38_08520 [Deltaproteobacteria bacterium]|jgi:hypothetical protein|nr:hypothetical protein [Deltaproteobacteria bacterium]